MSTFDDIANHIPRRRPLAKEPKDSCRRRAAVVVEALVPNAKHHQPTAFMSLLSEACLDEACRDALLKLDDVHAQALVDAIQSVSTPMLLLHDSWHTQRISDIRST
jgi:hypothetical protein